MVELKSFLPRLMPNVIGCPEPLALQALLDSSIAFCHRSQVLTHMANPISVAKGTANYEIDAPSQTAVSQVLKLWHDGNLLSPAPYETATALFSPEGAPRYYFGQEIDEIFNLTLLPTPDKNLTDGLQARVSLRPTRAATRVYDVLYERHLEAIVAGAMGILMATPDQSFTDFAMAGAQSVKAQALANNARSEAMRGRVQSSLSVRMRAF